MKKILIALLILALLTQFAAAKYVTTIFNFPEGTSQDIEELCTVPEDANAFHAFVTVAESSGLEMDLTYYESFDSWFVNGIDGVQNTQEQYWHFWVNNETSMVGISGHVPEDNDVIELGFADQPKGKKSSTEKALEWLAANQQESGEIGEHKTWGNAFALIALNLFPGNEAVKQKASEYLLSNQGEDAGFSYPGFDSDALHTAVSIIGLIASGQTVESFSKNGSTALGFLLSKQERDGGFSGWGQSDVDTTSWAILSFAAASQPMPTKNSNTPANYLISAQNSDGGFGYQAGQDSLEDYTAEALIAFSAENQGTGQAAGNALTWLKGQQSAEGCFSNAYTTALGTIALTAYEEDTSSAMQCLEGMQLPDNGFGRNNQTSNAVDTALAVIALSGKSLPTEKQAAEENPELVPVGSIVKFTVAITNYGMVSAKNVSISLQGISGSWVQQQTSETSIVEIKPNETVEAEIFVEMKGTGQKDVFASV